MNLLAPVALAMGVTLPIVVVFYLLKVRRHDEEVSSTFLWNDLIRDLAGDRHPGGRPPAGAGRRDGRPTAGRPRAGRCTAFRRRGGYARRAAPSPLARRRPQCATHLPLY